MRRSRRPDNPPNPERRRRPGRGIGHRQSNLGVSLISYLYKIKYFFPIKKGIIFFKLSEENNLR